MDEEQKQAIKELKHFTNMTVFWKEKEYTSHEIDNCINIVLHLIEKQQKEIENLKNDHINFWINTKEVEDMVRGKFIKKDKIRDIIFEFTPKSSHEVELRTKIIKLLGG